MFKAQSLWGRAKIIENYIKIGITLQNTTIVVKTQTEIFIQEETERKCIMPIKSFELDSASFASNLIYNFVARNHAKKKRLLYIHNLQTAVGKWITEDRDRSVGLSIFCDVFDNV